VAGHKSIQIVRRRYDVLVRRVPGKNGKGGTFVGKLLRSGFYPYVAHATDNIVAGLLPIF
jgi:hypothetical protein